jgi:hypothetical protein
MHVRGRDILEMEYRTTGGTREALLLMTDDHIIRISTEEEGFVQVREGSLAE